MKVNFSRADRNGVLLALTMASAMSSPISVARAAPISEPMGLNKVLILGAAHPISKRANFSAQADDALAESSQRQSSWPTITLSGYAERTDTLSTLSTPVGEISSGELNRGQVQATFKVPLWRESARLRADASALKATSSAFSAKRVADLRAMAAATAYLNLLALQANVQSTKSLHESLTVRLNRSKALLESGRVLKVDVLKIQFELARTSQDIARLNGQVAIAQRELADAVGSETAVEAAPLAWVPPSLSTGATLSDDAITESLRSRSDIRALRENIGSLSKSAESIAAENRPTVDMVAQHADRRGIGLLPRHENVISLQVSIPIFDAGTVAPRQLAKLREREALEATLTDSERSARTEVERAKVSFATAHSLKTLAAVGLESATQTLDMRRSLYEIGRLNLDDLLAAESDIARQKTLATTADLDIVHAWLDYQYALGRSMVDLQIPLGR